MTTKEYIMATAVEGKPSFRQRSAAMRDHPRYKWLVLSNTTLGVLMVMIDSSIALISLPEIFNGIHLNPLAPGNTSYFLWVLMGYLVVTAVMVVNFGRLGDMFGRSRMYNMGFAIFTFFSIMLSITWMHGSAGALWLIAMRIFQGLGGALLFANSAALLTDVFPANQRGLALGINNVTAIAGSFIGLILGGVLAPISWRLIFLVSVPVGIAGTIWAYMVLHDTGIRIKAKIDWLGNFLFAAGLISVLVGITYGIQPYGNQTMGWTNPGVIAAIVGGFATLGVFIWLELRLDEPMINVRLFKIRAFTAGNLASLLASLGRGGMMFILIIWLQGIWLPRHGFSYSQTPLWAGIYLVPLTIGFLVAGPVSGFLSDRFGARPFATGGMIIAAGSFIGLIFLPVNFSYFDFAALLAINGLAMGLFASPNRAGIMNSLPANQRGVGSGMSATFMNSAMVLSIGVFFSLMIFGLRSHLSSALLSGLTKQHVPVALAKQVAALPPVSTLFAAFLGYNPMSKLLGSKVLNTLPAANAHYLIGRSFFPSLISPAFGHGLSEAFTFAAIACLVAAGASWLRGGKYNAADAEEAMAHLHAEHAAEHAASHERGVEDKVVEPVAGADESVAPAEFDSTLTD
jgi:EmrB/QacA subfamily drug resistance transporter